ncbi:MAG TPA: GNAT family N-acetyltransferase [Streptosporangiaceae bacterium]|nr:GNAT family N-acetyltransferase [Streptosporangiaceae bacterium]
MTAPHPLDNPVRSSLAGPHARFAERRGHVLRYPADVSPFLALPDQPDAADWADVAALVGPGALVALAMAGERLHPPGWTEISAVCTDEAWRGLGFASRLMRTLVAGIRARGETAFLHAVADNPAVGLYEALGFRLRRSTVFSAARVPADQPAE